LKSHRPTIRFERIELDYGRHSGVFTLVPPGDRTAPVATNGSGNGAGTPRGRPFVILGPNGAGKTTLLEAIVRTLFGFRRTTKAGRDTHERRRPWAGGPYGARVTVRTGEGRFTYERDFETDMVRVMSETRDAPLFEAEANPSRSGEKVRRYREILRQTIGIAELDSYRKTAWVSQGGLLDTGISVDLLRVAAGGHTDVESAQKRLKKEYGALTTEPIAPGASRRRTPGELERLDAEIESLEAELARARALEERRAPLVHARDEGLGRLDALMD
jgi:energy-coupling factor transporter ATP-binding protein EcfA2